MAIFDPTLPLARRCGEERINVNIKNYNARTKEKWCVEGNQMYSIEVEFEFEKCIKKILGICIKKEKYKKWIEIPLRIYTPDFYPAYLPINYISKKDLDKRFFLDLPEIKSESEAKAFFDKVIENHLNIIKKEDKDDYC